MPIPLSPGGTFELILKGDQALDEKGKPLKTQPPEAPRFMFRHLSGREQRALAVKLDEMESAEESAAVAVDKTFECLAFVLVGWKNLHDDRKDGAAVPYDPAAADQVLTWREAQELIYRVWGWRPDENFSDSQSNSASAGSAAPAAAESA